jgi:phosphotransferase system  glucose/maltose/N-acetylglucosamine-specific IIC component
MFILLYFIVMAILLAAFIKFNLKHKWVTKFGVRRDEPPMILLIVMILVYPLTLIVLGVILGIKKFWNKFLPELPSYMDRNR